MTTMETYRNNRSAHQLRRFKNGVGECSCGDLRAEGFSEESLIRTHQFHVTNLEPLDDEE